MDDRIGVDMRRQKIHGIFLSFLFQDNSSVQRMKTEQRQTPPRISYLPQGVSYGFFKNLNFFDTHGSKFRCKEMSERF